MDTVEDRKLLSNPNMDELYSIRRILVGQYNAFSQIPHREYEKEYYRRKVDALDSAISALIALDGVPVEHTEVTRPVDEASSLKEALTNLGKKSY